MKLTVKQKVLKLLDTYEMTDEKGNLIFTAKGKISVSKRIDLYDATGEVIGSVREKLVDVLEHYRIYVSDEHVGDIVKNLSVIRDRYAFTFNKWSVKADPVNFRYEFLDGRRKIAVLSRHAVRVVHPVYTIEIEDDHDAIEVALASLAIFSMNEENKQQ